MNNIGEDEDDEIAVLSGDTEIDTDHGPAIAWHWEVKIEAEVNTLGNPPSAELKASGLVRHRRRPHGEKDEGLPMPYDLRVGKAASCTFGFCTISNTLLKDRGADHKPHPPHEDVLNPAELSAHCCLFPPLIAIPTIDDFTLHLHAMHTPEPSSFVLLGSGVVLLVGVSWRRRMRV